MKKRNIFFLFSQRYSIRLFLLVLWMSSTHSRSRATNDDDVIHPLTNTFEWMKWNRQNDERRKTAKKGINRTHHLHSTVTRIIKFSFFSKTHSRALSNIEKRANEHWNETKCCRCAGCLLPAASPLLLHTTVFVLLSVIQLLWYFFLPSFDIFLFHFFHLFHAQCSHTCAESRQSSERASNCALNESENTVELKMKIRNKVWISFDSTHFDSLAPLAARFLAMFISISNADGIGWELDSVGRSSRIIIIFAYVVFHFFPNNEELLHFENHARSVASSAAAAFSSFSSLALLKSYSRNRRKKEKLLTISRNNNNFPSFAFRFVWACCVSFLSIPLTSFDPTPSAEAPPRKRRERGTRNENRERFPATRKSSHKTHERIVQFDDKMQNLILEWNCAALHLPPPSSPTFPSFFPLPSSTILHRRERTKEGEFERSQNI